VVTQLLSTDKWSDGRCRVYGNGVSFSFDFLEDRPEVEPVLLAVLLPEAGSEELANGGWVVLPEVALGEGIDETEEAEAAEIDVEVDVALEALEDEEY